jgi:hypothetical protein
MQYGAARELFCQRVEAEGAAARLWLKKTDKKKARKTRVENSRTTS